MIEDDMPTLGLKQMHPLQVLALMDFVGKALKLAALTDDEEILREVESSADELVRLFGGNGVKVTVEAYSRCWRRRISSLAACAAGSLPKTDGARD